MDVYFAVDGDAADGNGLGVGAFCAHPRCGWEGDLLNHKSPVYLVLHLSDGLRYRVCCGYILPGGCLLVAGDFDLAAGVIAGLRCHRSGAAVKARNSTGADGVRYILQIGDHCGLGCVSGYRQLVHSTACIDILLHQRRKRVLRLRHKSNRCFGVCHVNLDKQSTGDGAAGRKRRIDCLGFHNKVSTEDYTTAIGNIDDVTALCSYLNARKDAAVVDNVVVQVRIIRWSYDRCVILEQRYHAFALLSRIRILVRSARTTPKVIFVTSCDLA